MKKLSKLPAEGPEWEFSSLCFWHANLQDSDVQLTQSELIGKNCIGFSNTYTRKNRKELMYCEFDFFDSGIVLKMWGFEEDFKNDRQQAAILYKGEWLQQEEGDDFIWGVNFSPQKEVKMFWIGLSNRHKEIRVEIRPG